MNLNPNCEGDLYHIYIQRKDYNIPSGSKVHQAPLLHTPPHPPKKINK